MQDILEGQIEIISALKSEAKTKSRFYTCLDCNLNALSNEKDIIGMSPHPNNKWSIVRENIETNKVSLYQDSFSSHVYGVIANENLRRLYSSGINGVINQFDLDSRVLIKTFKVPCERAISLSIYKNYLLIGSKYKVFLYDMLNQDKMLLEEESGSKFVFNPRIVQDTDALSGKRVLAIFSGGYSDEIEFKMISFSL